MAALRFAYGVGGVELGLGVVSLWRLGRSSYSPQLVSCRQERSPPLLRSLALSTLLPIGATLMLGGFAARRGWRRWYWYASSAARDPVGDGADFPSGAAALFLNGTPGYCCRSGFVARMVPARARAISGEQTLCVRRRLQQVRGFHEAIEFARGDNRQILHGLDGATIAGSRVLSTPCPKSRRRCSRA